MKRCQKSHKNSQHGYIMGVIITVTFGIFAFMYGNKLPRQNSVCRRNCSDWTMETAKKCQKSHKNSRHGYIMAVIFTVTFGIFAIGYGNTLPIKNSVYKRNCSVWTIITAKKCQKSQKNSRHGYIMDAIFTIITSNRAVMDTYHILRDEPPSSICLAWSAFTDAAAAAAAGYSKRATENGGKAI